MALTYRHLHKQLRCGQVVRGRKEWITCILFEQKEKKKHQLLAGPRQLGHRDGQLMT